MYSENNGWGKKPGREHTPSNANCPICGQWYGPEHWCKAPLGGPPTILTPPDIDKEDPANPYREQVEVRVKRGRRHISENEVSDSN